MCEIIKQIQEFLITFILEGDIVCLLELAEDELFVYNGLIRVLAQLSRGVETL